MKKVLLLVSLLAFSVLGLSAQSFPVKFQGEKPNISDFAWAYVNYELAPAEDEDEEEGEGFYNESIGAVKNAMEKQRANKAQEPGVTLSIDQRNGFVLYEWKDPDSSNRLRVEMCYWNESDGKHKLFAYNVCCFRNGECSPGQFDGLLFYRYDNATKKMTLCNDVGFDVEFGTNDGDDVAYISYALPRTGKDIILTTWYKRGKQQKTLKWNGRRFTM